MVVLAAVLYLSLLGTFFMLQEWLIFPGRVSQGRPEAVIRPNTARGEVLLGATTSRGDRAVALLCPAADTQGQPLAAPRDQPLMLLFHGNGESAADLVGLARHLASSRINVVVVEYPGFGMSSGKPGEAAIYAGVDAILEALRLRRDLDCSKLVPVGWSLGAAVAIDVASRHPVRGVVALSPFTSLPAVGKRTLWFLPVRWLARHRFDNLAKMPTLRVPVFLAHGRQDRIVPFEMAEALAGVVKAPLTTRWLDAGHNDLLEVGGEKLLGEIVGFVRASAGEATTAPGG